MDFGYLALMWKYLEFYRCLTLIVSNVHIQHGYIRTGRTSVGYRQIFVGNHCRFVIDITRLMMQEQCVTSDCHNGYGPETLFWSLVLVLAYKACRSGVEDDTIEA